MFFAGIRKFPSIPRTELRSFVQDLLPACNAPLDAGVIAAALEIEARHALHWWDCVIVASALSAGADYLLTEDMQHERTIGGMTIINPFLTEPSDILSAS
jgi:predicted nucleic acid-binding protein